MTAEVVDLAEVRARRDQARTLRLVAGWLVAGAFMYGCFRLLHAKRAVQS